MGKKHLLIKIILILSLAVINFCCYSYSSIPKEEITKKDTDKDFRITLKDGLVYTLHANAFVIEDSLFKIKGEHEKIIYFSKVKEIEVNKLGTGETFFYTLAFIVVLFTIILAGYNR